MPLISSVPTFNNETFGFSFGNKDLNKFKKRLDPRLYNGAIFLGLDSPVVKSHGSTDSLGFCHSLNMCEKIVKSDLINKIKSNLITVDAK